MASSNDWNWLKPHTTARVLTMTKGNTKKTHNYRNLFFYLCPTTNTQKPIYAHTQRKGKKRQLFSWNPAKSTHRNTFPQTHCTEGLWECSTGICPKSEIIAAERMKQCKLIKDKNCLLLNRLKGNLIVLLCLWDSSGSWESTAALLTECHTAAFNTRSLKQGHHHQIYKHTLYCATYGN